MRYLLALLLIACSAPPEIEPMNVMPAVDAVDLAEVRDLAVAELVRLPDLVAPADLTQPLPDLVGLADYYGCIGQRCDSLLCKWDPLPPIVPGCNAGMICGKASQPCRGGADCCSGECKASSCCIPHGGGNCRANNCCGGPGRCIPVEGETFCCIPKGEHNWHGPRGMRGPEAFCCPGTTYDSVERTCE